MAYVKGQREIYELAASGAEAPVLIVNAKGQGLSAFDYLPDGHGFATILRLWAGGLSLATGEFP